MLLVQGDILLNSCIDQGFVLFIFEVKEVLDVFHKYFLIAAFFNTSDGKLLVFTCCYKYCFHTYCSFLVILCSLFCLQKIFYFPFHLIMNNLIRINADAMVSPFKFQNAMKLLFHRGQKLPTNI